jgi:hypothetical protein
MGLGHDRGLGPGPACLLSGCTGLICGRMSSSPHLISGFGFAPGLHITIVTGCVLAAASATIL